MRTVSMPAAFHAATASGARSWSKSRVASSEMPVRTSGDAAVGPAAARSAVRAAARIAEVRRIGAHPCKGGGGRGRPGGHCAGGGGGEGAGRGARGGGGDEAGRVPAAVGGSRRAGPSAHRL